MRLIALPLVGALLLAGCAGPRVPAVTSRSMSLSMGMDKQQVISVMGAPRKTSAKMTEVGLSERYFWWTPTRIGFTNVDNEMLTPDRVFVRFVNGKVVEWGDKYDYSAAMETVTDAQREALRSPRPTAAP